MGCTSGKDIFGGRSNICFPGTFPGRGRRGVWMLRKKREAAPNGFPIAKNCMGEAVLHGSFRVEYVDLFEVIPQIFPFIGAQNPKRKGN